MTADVIIVGGGASGCYAAVTAARRGRSVLLLDGNDRLCHKLTLTGKGRCNVTNDCDRDTLMQNIPRGGRFLYSALSRCTPQDVMAFFEDAGVPLKTERGRRVFPVSDRAGDIADALICAMKAAGVRIRLRAGVRHLILGNGCCTGVQLGDGERILAQSVLLATGGMSYPRTGSTGIGLKLAQEAGHTVIPMQPSLIPLETAETEPAEMQGLSLKNVTLTVTQNGRRIFSEMGEMLFTHFGVSGPLVLSASAYMEPENAASYLLTVDLKPALTAEQLDLRIQRDIAAGTNKAASNALRGLMPASMLPVILRRSGIPAECRAHSVTRTQRAALVGALKGYTLHAAAMRPIAEAIISRGGVSLKEINPATMASKCTGGLYFSGELLDADALTGGYNLQIAFATGYAAGCAV